MSLGKLGESMYSKSEVEEIIAQYKSLCLRAADALEAWSDKRHPLVQELRKAAGG